MTETPAQPHVLRGTCAPSGCAVRKATYSGPHSRRSLPPLVLELNVLDEHCNPATPSTDASVPTAYCHISRSLGGAAGPVVRGGAR
jgi:hypothetical protein